MPNNDSFYASRADAKQKLEDYQGAIDDFTKAIEIDPKSTTVAIKNFFIVIILLFKC